VMIQVQEGNLVVFLPQDEKHLHKMFTFHENIVTKRVKYSSVNLADLSPRR
jgi:hypothetical protein